MIVLQLLVAVGALVANAFFVGAEFALVSVRRSGIEPHAERGERRAVTVLWGLERLSALLAAAQLGVTLCTLVLGAVAEPAVAGLLDPMLRAAGVPAGAGRAVSFALALALATYGHMLLGEMVPKNVALAGPVRAALALGPPLVGLARALRLVIGAVNALANGVLRLLGVEPKGAVASAFSDDELGRMVADSGAAGLLDRGSTRRLRDALALGRRPVGAVARPTGQVVAARLGVTPQDLERLSAASGFSRFPVVDAGGRALGYLHVKDALDAAPREEPFPASALRPIARVAASVPLDEVLAAMRAGGSHLAAVIGAEGRTQGVVTMADVLRELVGRRPGTP